MKNFNKFQYSKWTVHNTTKGGKKKKQYKICSKYLRSLPGKRMSTLNIK